MMNILKYYLIFSKIPYIDWENQNEPTSHLNSVNQIESQQRYEEKNLNKSLLLLLFYYWF